MQSYFLNLENIASYTESAIEKVEKVPDKSVFFLKVLLCVFLPHESSVYYPILICSYFFTNIII